MRRMVLPVVVIVLIVGAFGVGFATRSFVERGSDQTTRPQDQQAQNPQAKQPQDQAPSQDQQQPKSQSRSKDRAGGGKSAVTAVVDRVENGRLIVTVQDARGGGVQQGSSLTIDVGQGVEILREIPLSELKKGDIIILRGSMDAGRFIVQGIRSEVRK